MNSPITACGIAATLALTAALAPAQATAILSPVQDTTLYEDATGSLANGGGGTLFVGRAGGSSGGAKRRALLQFDVTGAIPANAVIVSAALVMFVEQTSATSPTTTFVHRVTAPWSEGTTVAAGSGGGGAAANPGDSTWLHRDFPGVLWTDVGGDFDATPSSTFAMPTSGLATSQNSNAMVADIEAWIANPASNFGWLLKTDEAQTSTARRLGSRESPLSPPTLHISYLLPGDSALAGFGCPVGGSATQRFSLGISTAPVSAGTTLPLFYVTGPANSVGASFFSLGLDRTGVQLFPECSTYLPGPLVAGGLFFTDGSGVAFDSYVVPPGGAGFLISVQGAAIDGASPLGFTLSNAGAMLTQ